MSYWQLGCDAARTCEPEAELEALLRKIGFFFETEAQVFAATPKAVI